VERNDYYDGFIDGYDMGIKRGREEMKQKVLKRLDEMTIQI
jgi:hypothetical protein